MRLLGDVSKIFDDPAFRRVELALGLLLTIPGIPMIWMGLEFGFAAERSLDPRPLDWSLLKNDLNKQLNDYTKTFIRIRNQNPALRSDSFQVVLKDQGRQLFGYKRWDGGGDVVVIVANLKDEPSGEFVIENAGLEDGNWKDAVHGNEIKVEGGVLRDTLGPSEVKVFVKQA